MTIPEITAKLASGATPRLLSCKEAGMSEGPWEIHCAETHKGHYAFSIHNACGGLMFDGQTTWKIDENSQEYKDAKFFAVTNGERPVCELLWKIYGLLAPLIGTLWVFSALKGWCDDLIVIQHEILLFLSAANRLGWVKKKEK